MREFALTNKYTREAAIIAVGYIVYLALRLTLLNNVAPSSFINAERVVNFERRLSFFHEPAIQAWLLEHAHAFIVAANWFYSIGFFPRTEAVLRWIFRSPKTPAPEGAG